MQVETRIDSRLKGPFADQSISDPVQAVGLARRAVDIADRLLLLDDARAQIAQELLLMYDESGNERVRLDALKSGVRELRLLRDDWLKDAARLEKTGKAAPTTQSTDDADLKLPDKVTPENAAQAAEALRAGVADAREKIVSQLKERKSACEESHATGETGNEGFTTEMNPPPHSQAHRAGQNPGLTGGKRPRGSRRLA